MLNWEWGGGGGRATHGNLIVRSILWVGILIVHDVPRMGNLSAKTFVCQRVENCDTFDHSRCRPGGG